MNFLSITQAADAIGVRPRIISDLIYARAVDLARCPMFGNRRIVEASYLPALRQLLVQRGKIAEEAAAQ